MKKVGKPVIFIVIALIAVLTYLSFFGISTTYGDYHTVYVKGANDIRWGIDIRGGVDVTFTPSGDIDATDEQMASAEAVIELRLLAQNITDAEVYTDYDKDRIIVRFPWKENEADFDPAKAISELGETALLTFREGMEMDSTTGAPTGTTKENIVLQGNDVVSATPVVNQQNNQLMVQLELSEEGKTKFAEATKRLKGKIISIWMDDTIISYPTVETEITDGTAVITGNFTVEEVRDLANKISAGALPFKLETENYRTISPTLGIGARDAMLLAGVIAFVLICILMIVLYRLPGLVASIALIGQVAGSIAAVSGFFPNIPSFTLTLPGMAGIILAIGIGVDANIITAERIKEELKNGKTLEGAIDVGFSRAFTAVFDGNITVIIVAIILMGAFGDPNGFLATLLTPFFFMFGPATSGTVYSFGYTLLVGVILNFVMGVGAARLMLKSASKFKCLRKNWLYGGKK